MLGGDGRAFLFGTEMQLTHDALHDSLTGLANRTLALNRIKHLILRKRRDPSLSYGFS